MFQLHFWKLSFAVSRENISSYSFKRPPHKMVKQTQTIRRQEPTTCLSVFDQVVGLVLKGLAHFIPMFPFFSAFVKCGEILKMKGNFCSKLVFEKVKRLVGSFLNKFIGFELTTTFQKSSFFIFFNIFIATFT